MDKHKVNRTTVKETAPILDLRTQIESDIALCYLSNSDNPVKKLKIQKYQKQLYQNISKIQNTIQNERLSDDFISTFLLQWTTRPPKKTGNVIEAFTKEKHGYLDSDGKHYDALSPSGQRIEIKASRVLIDNFEMKADNIFDDIMQASRVYPHFSNILKSDFLCNIQQIKTSEFDTLYYYLFLNDVILEFSMDSSKIKDVSISEGLAEFRNQLKIFKKKTEIKEFDSLDFSSYITTYKINKLKSLAGDDERLIAFLEQSDIISNIYQKYKLGYSDKQHKGNEGEGQFHITKDNILFHISENFVNAYNFADFSETLKQRKIHNESNSTKPSLSH